MSENMLWLVITGGVLIGAAGIVLLANFIERRDIRRREKRLKKDIAAGKYDPNKKYFGNQGGWDRSDDPFNWPAK